MVKSCNSKEQIEIVSGTVLSSLPDIISRWEVSAGGETRRREIKLANYTSHCCLVDTR